MAGIIQAKIGTWHLLPQNELGGRTQKVGEQGSNKNRRGSGIINVPDGGGGVRSAVRVNGKKGGTS